jgi:hypothetical protein
MRRWALRIFVFLLLGAIVNVAVAWGCCRWMRVAPVLRRGTPNLVMINPPGTWIARDGSHIATVRDVAWLGMTEANLLHHDQRAVATVEPVAHGEGVEYDRILYSDEFAESPAISLFRMQYFAARVRAGLPFPSLCGGIVDRRVIEHGRVSEQKTGILSKTTNLPILPGATAAWAIAVAESVPLSAAEYGTLLPLLPIWPGFAINTVFYAAILWTLFAAPFALRKWRRIRRGLCPKCGYDLRGGATDSATCPECGATR